MPESDFSFNGPRTTCSYSAILFIYFLPEFRLKIFCYHDFTRELQMAPFVFQVFTSYAVTFQLYLLNLKIDIPTWLKNRSRDEKFINEPSLILTPSSHQQGVRPLWWSYGRTRTAARSIRYLPPSTIKAFHLHMVCKLTGR